MKVAISLILSLILNVAFCQVSLTPDGVKSSSNLASDFVVLNFDQKQSDLYNSALTAMTKLYRSPKYVIDKVENTSIKVSANSDVIAVHKLTMLEKQKYSIDYVVHLDFKDNRMRVSIPTVLYKQESLSGFDFFLVAQKKAIGRRNGIWDNEGNLKNDWLKVATESYLNNWIAWLDKSIKENTTW